MPSPDAIGVSEVELSREPRKRNVALGSYPALDQPLDSYRKLHVMTQKERQWVTRLVVMSVFDLGVSSMVALVAFSTAWADAGLSLYCIGFQASAHFLSSLICLSRFFKESRWGRHGDRDGRPGSAPHEDEEASLLTERKTDFQREQKLNIFVGVLLLLSAAVLMFKAARKFKFWESWHADQQAVREQSETAVRTISEVLAWKSGGMYAVQALLRWFAKLDCEGDKFTNHLFWVSATSCLFCLVLACSASWQAEWSYKAEAVGAALLSVGSCAEGMRILYVYFDDIDDLMTRHERP